MGVRGLLSFISNRDAFFKECKLNDGHLVIDGYNLMYYLYGRCPRRNCCFGGDYEKYAVFVRDFFHELVRRGIQPVVVLDGAFQDVKRRTLWQRSREQASKAVRCNPANHHRNVILPIFAKETFVNVVKKVEGSTIVTAFFEADAHLAAIASRLRCPVVSNDSDFFIFDVRLVTVRSLFEAVATQRNSDDGQLRCEEFDRDAFFSAFEVRDPEHLFLVAVLVGNDYVAPKSFEAIFNQIALPKRKSMGRRHRKMTGLLRWLSRQPNAGSAVDRLLTHVPLDSRPRARAKLEKAADMYRIKGPRCARVQEVLEQIYSRERLGLGSKIDEGFLRNFFFRSGTSPALNVLVNATFFLSSQVEVRELESSHRFARPILERYCAVAVGLNEASDEVSSVKMICRSGDRAAAFPIVVKRVVPSEDEGWKRFYLISALTCERTRPPVVERCDGDDKWTLLLCSMCFWSENSAAEVKPSTLHLLAVAVCTVLHERGEPADFAARYKELNWSSTSIEFRPKIVHCFSNLQAVLYHASVLNDVLGAPLEPVDPRFWRGTVLYNAVRNYDSTEKLLRAFAAEDAEVKSRAIDRFESWMRILELERVTPPATKSRRRRRRQSQGKKIEELEPEPDSSDSLDAARFVDLNNKFALLSTF